MAFVYCQGPIQSRISVVEPGTTVHVTIANDKGRNGSYLVGADGTIAMKGIAPIPIAEMHANAAAEKIARMLALPGQAEAKPTVSLTTPSVMTIFPVWATGAFSGAMLNLLYPALLMTKRRSWGVLLKNWREVGLTGIMGFQTMLALTLPGKGMLMLGALGAAIGGGIQQAMQMVGGQGTGFISGEWRGVQGKPRLQMYGSIALLLLAAVIMAVSETLKP